MDHNMVFGYGYCWWQNRQWYEHVPPPLAILMAMAVCWCNTKHITQCSISRATPEATGCQHWATTCSVLPLRRQGNRQTNNNQQIHLKSWLFWWPRQCAGTIPHASPNRGSPGLHSKPLDATIGWALAPININWTYLRQFFLRFFIINSYKKVAGWR